MTQGADKVLKVSETFSLGAHNQSLILIVRVTSSLNIIIRSSKINLSDFKHPRKVLSFIADSDEDIIEQVQRQAAIETAIQKHSSISNKEQIPFT